MRELKTDQIKPVVNRSWEETTAVLRAKETSGQSLIYPYLTTCGSARKVHFQKYLHFPIDLSPMKLDTHTPNSHGLALCGRHFKNKCKGNLPSMVYIIQSAIQTNTSHLHRKKIIKTVNKKNSQVTASLYTKKFTSSSIWPLPQMHICPYKAQLPEPTLQPELYKKQKNCPKSEPTKSFSFLPCLQRTETFHSAHQGEWSDFHYS